MKIYLLQAVLKDQTILYLDFLPGFQGSLIDIDRLTNKYDFWQFMKVLAEYLDHSIIENIDSFQIAVRGKNYAYSVCFQNAYLSDVLNDTSTFSSSRETISPRSSAFVEMKDFLFQDLNCGGKNFTEQYVYRNRLSRLVSRYIQSYSDCWEDLSGKYEIERQIVQEMSNYQTYRSLCLYRKRLERIPKKRVVSSPTVGTGSISFVPSNREPLFEENTSKYPLRWENLCGDEREEFLEPEEIKQMVKDYGES